MKNTNHIFTTIITLGTLGFAQSFNLALAVPINVGCIYQKDGIAEVAGFCSLNHSTEESAILTWPDGVTTELKFDLNGTENRVRIDNQNVGKFKLGSDFYHIEYRTDSGQLRKIFIVGSCLRCS